MVFIDEEISGEDKSKIDLNKFKKTAGIYHVTKSWGWTIDCEKNVFFLYWNGGDTERPEIY